MKCPHCNETLHMTHREGIEIDYCPECRGVWLDRGELDKLIERSEAWSGGAQPQPAREQHRSSEREEHRDRDYDRDDRRSVAPPKKKKKSSFVGDLFENFGDFGG